MAIDPTDWDNTNMGNGVIGGGAGMMHGAVIHRAAGDEFLSTTAFDSTAVDAACYDTSSVRVKNQVNWERWPLSIATDSFSPHFDRTDV
jgi:hypothetical protein